MADLLTPVEGKQGGESFVRAMPSLTSGKQQQTPQYGPHEYARLDSENDLELETEMETEAFDDDPFEDILDVDGSVADYLLYAQLTCLPRIISSLKCDEALPGCGSCKALNLKRCRVGDTQDREQKGDSESDIRLLRIDMDVTMGTPLATRNPELRVDGLNAEEAVECLEGELAASSVLSQDSHPLKSIDRYAYYSHHFTIRQPNGSLHSLPRHSPGYAPLRTKQSTTSARKMTLNTRNRSRSDPEVLGEAESHPIEVSSGDSDSKSDVPREFAQSRGSTVHPNTSHSPTSPFSSSSTDLRHTSHLRKASKVSSVSGERIILGKRRCIHDVLGNENPVKVRQTAIPRLNGRKSDIQAITQQPVSRKIGSVGDDRSENKITSTLPTLPVRVMQRSFSMASAHSNSPDYSDLPTSRSQKRHLATRLHAKSQPYSSEDSDPPINPSQKRRLARRHPAESNRQLDSSEDHDPPINPSQKRRLTRHHPAKSKSRPDSSEDSDSSLAFARRTPLTTSQYARLNDADTPEPSTKRFNPERSETFGDIGVDTSDSDAPLVPSWKRTHERFTPISPDRHLDDDRLKSLLQASGTEGLQNPRIGLRFGGSLLGEPSTNTSGNPIQESRSPTSLTVHNARQHPAPIIPQTGKPIDPIQVLRPARPVSSQTADDEVSAEIVEQELLSPKPRKSKKEKAQQTLTSGNRATKSPEERPKFGIRDIVPEAVSSKRRSFTLDDVIPSKAPKKPIPTRWGLELTEFHDPLRLSFAPVVVAPDWILNAPLKKRKFTLADVTGTGPQEPLFSVEYALEQYQARQNDQKQPFPNGITDQPRGAEDAVAREQKVVSDDKDFMALGSNDTSGERPIHDSKYIVESTADKATGPDWTQMVDDAEDYLAADENMASSKKVEYAVSESGEGQSQSFKFQLSTKGT